MGRAVLDRTPAKPASVGMAAFAAALWVGLDRWPLAAAFALALLAWAAVAFAAWALRRPLVNLFPRHG